MSASLKIKQFGRFEVWRQGARVAGKAWGRRKTQSVLKVLLTEPGKLWSQDQLVEALFPEFSPEKARVNLRGRISELRRALEPGLAKSTASRYVLTVGNAYCFNGEAACWIDTEAFKGHLDEAQRALQRERVPQALTALRQAVELYTDEYLAEDLYEDWAQAPREGFRKATVTALSQGAECLARLGDLDEAVAWCQRALALDPYREATHRQLMRYAHHAGRPRTAREAHQRCVDALAELGQAPEPDTVRLWDQIQAGKVPPLRRFVPHNLPAALGAFVGRKRALASIPRELAEHRLLTLVGLGGCGKTRLALEVAHQLLQAGGYEHGVWFVELAPLRDAETVVHHLAKTLGLHDPGDALAALKDHLKPQRALLVLDNAEHLVDACAPLCESLIQACPHLAILVTSRAPLRAGAERVHPVPPLACPAPEADAPPEQLARYDAVRLFVERGARVSASFALTADNAACVAEVCRRLEGIPLALELAASRLNALSVFQVAERLGDRFALLTAGARTAAPRQQTLLDTMDWSHELLGEPARRLLRRLAAFEGGFCLEAAEAVCSGDGLAAPDVLDLLSGLVDQSLVLAGDGEAKRQRYRQLETVRQFGQRQLDAHGEARRCGEKHLAYHVQLAERGAAQLAGAEATQGAEALQAELDNFRKALDFALEDAATAEAGLRLATALAPFWNLRGYWREGRQWLEKALARSPRRDLARATALNHLGVLAQKQADFAEAAAHIKESIAIKEACGDGHGKAISLTNLGNLHTRLGDFDEAVTCQREAARLFAQHEDRQREAKVWNNLGAIHFLQGHYETALESFERSLELFQALDDPQRSGQCLNNLGVGHKELGDYTRAIVYHLQALELFDAVDDQDNLALTYSQLALAHANLATETDLYFAFEPVAHPEALGEALSYLESALAIHQRLNHARELAHDHFNLGCVHCSMGQPQRALSHLAKALKAAEPLDDAKLLVRIRSALARAHAQAGHLNSAAVYSAQAVEQLAQVDAQDFEDVYFAHYRILDWANDGAALDFLKKAHEITIQKMEQAPSPQRRAHIATLNKDILAAWQALQP